MIGQQAQTGQLSLVLYYFWKQHGPICEKLKKNTLNEISSNWQFPFNFVFCHTQIMKLDSHWWTTTLLNDLATRFQSRIKKLLNSIPHSQIATKILFWPRFFHKYRVFNIMVQRTGNDLFNLTYLSSGIVMYLSHFAPIQLSKISFH